MVNVVFILIVVWGKIKWKKEIVIVFLLINKGYIYLKIVWLVDNCCVVSVVVYVEVVDENLFCCL